MTKEKLNGTFKRPPILTKEKLRELESDYMVEFIKKYYDEYPDMFQRFPEAKEKFLNQLKGNRIKLRKYPDVIEAMFVKEEIPEDLRVDENRHKSAIIGLLDAHLNRRKTIIDTEKDVH